jgi:hypothetical protein
VLTPRFASSDAEMPGHDSAILVAYSGRRDRRPGARRAVKLLRRAAVISLSVQPIELPARDG